MKTMRLRFLDRVASIVGAALWVALAWSPSAQAEARTASVTGAWNAAATWGGAAVPGAADGVTINAGVTVTVPAAYAAQCTTIDFTTGSGAAGIVLAEATASLTASGTVTIQRNGNGANTLDVGAGTFSAPGVALQGTTGGTNLSQLLISTGTASVYSFLGGITSAGVDSRIVFSGTGTLNVAGAFLSGTAGTFTAGTGTVIFNDTMADQNVGPYTFWNLTLRNDSGSADRTKTMPAGAAVAGNLRIAPPARVIIEDGQNLSVGSLTLQLDGRINGTWGSTTATLATHQNDTYFNPSTGYLTVIDDLRVITTVTTWPEATPITFGQTLASSSLGYGVSVPSGQWVFDSPTTVPPPGNYSAAVSLVPLDPTTATGVTGGRVTVSVVYQAIASVSGDWNDTATWGGSPVPGANDAVVINSGITVTVPAGCAAQCVTIAFVIPGADAAAINLADATASLAVSKTVTLKTSAGPRTLNVGAGTFSAGDLTLGGAATGTQLCQLLISTGTASIGSADHGAYLYTNGVDSQVHITGAGTLNPTFLTFSEPI